MYKIGIVGCGHIGQAIVKLLQDKYKITVFDQVKPNVENLNVDFVKGNFLNDDELISFAKKNDAIINASPFFANIHIATACYKTKTHYFDLSEESKNLPDILKFSQSVDQAFAPHCGLAPGVVNIIAADLINKFEKVELVEMKVGALPLYPTNKIKYNITWSPDGLINEYCQDCYILQNNEKVRVKAMSGFEQFIFSGKEYEAFYTAGGIGTLCDSFKHKVKNMHYKTIRYKGHHNYFSFLLDELNFRDNQKKLTELIKKSIARTNKDVIVMLIKAIGNHEEIFCTQIYGNKQMTAIQLATASGVCAILEYVLNNNITGLVKQEEISLNNFKKSKYAEVYFNE